MVDINFLKDIEMQLENELGGKVIIAKMVGYIGRLKKKYLRSGQKGGLVNE